MKIFQITNLSESSRIEIERILILKEVNVENKIFKMKLKLFEFKINEFSKLHNRVRRWQFSCLKSNKMINIKKWKSVWNAAMSVRSGIFNKFA